MHLSVYKEVQAINSRLISSTYQQIKSIKASENKVKLTVIPDSGFWVDKQLEFEIKTSAYPKSPCRVQCKSEIIHPNILEADGEVCLSLFDEDWQPSMVIADYIFGILFLLHNPNFEDPLSDFFCIAKEQGKLAQAIDSLLAS
jgi:ubiquitin-protein ligase